MMGTMRRESQRGHAPLRPPAPASSYKQGAEQVSAEVSGPEKGNREQLRSGMSLETPFRWWLRRSITLQCRHVSAPFPGSPTHPHSSRPPGAGERGSGRRTCGDGGAAATNRAAGQAAECARHVHQPAAAEQGEDMDPSIPGCVEWRPLVSIQNLVGGAALYMWSLEEGGARALRQQAPKEEASRSAIHAGRLCCSSAASR